MSKTKFVAAGLTVRAFNAAISAERRATIQLLKKAGDDWRRLAEDTDNLRTRREYGSRGDHLRTDAVAALEEAPCHFCKAVATRIAHCDRCGGRLFHCTTHEPDAAILIITAHAEFRGEIVVFIAPATEPESREQGGELAHAPRPGAHNIRFLSRPN